MPRENDTEREDLAELQRRRELTEDTARGEAVAKRHERGGRTARENVADLIDEGSWVEYGRYAVAQQRARPLALTQRQRQRAASLPLAQRRTRGPRTSRPRRRPVPWVLT